ncbi:hypothetical protein [Methylorubrum rhodesianum]|uniref:hypothetical protein n=1 Tax=Methylorubrum rhodesianum TaxID=29427 RepID=UPI0028978DE9|nr:hypothetical protein [Methylorubrum rhodesianum]
MDAIADLGARLCGFTVEHPEPVRLAGLLRRWSIDRPPTVSDGAELRYRAKIETPGGLRELT